MTTCPTCGSLVSIHSGKEGTNSYVSKDREVEELVDAVISFALVDHTRAGRAEARARLLRAVDAVKR